MHMTDTSDPSVMPVEVLAEFDMPMRDYPELVEATKREGLPEPGPGEAIKEYLERLNQYCHNVFPVRAAIIAKFGITQEQFDEYHRERFPGSRLIPRPKTA
jgi:hypothetical protein